MKRLRKFCSSIIIACSLLSSCNQEQETAKILTAAKQAEQEGNTIEAAELYHKLAHRKPRDFQAQYQAALTSIHVANLKEARELLKRQSEAAKSPSIYVLCYGTGGVGVGGPYLLYARSIWARMSLRLFP